MKQCVFVSCMGVCCAFMCFSYGVMCLLCGFYVLGTCVLLLVIWSCHYFFYVYVCFCVSWVLCLACVLCFQYSINHLVLIRVFYLSLLWNFCVLFRSCVFDVWFMFCVSNHPFWRYCTMWINGQMEARTKEELLRNIKIDQKNLSF